MNDTQTQQKAGQVSPGDKKKKAGSGGENKPKASAKTPRQRFLAECERRVNQLLKAMVRVGRMGNRKQYESSDAEMRAIIELVKQKANKMIAAMWGEKEEANEFKLSSLPSTNGMPQQA